MYWTAGLSKWNEPWLSGNAMDYILRQDCYARPLSGWLLSFDFLPPLLSYGTLVAELFEALNSRAISKSFNVTTDWTRVELTYPADTTGVIGDNTVEGLRLLIWMHAGSDFTSGSLQTSWGSLVNANRAVGIGSVVDSTSRTFFITGAQMEVGTVATEFEHRTFAEELALCQRYFIRYPSLADASTTMYYTLGMIHSSSIAYFTLTLPVPMRTQPDLSISGTADFQSVDSGTIRNLTNLTLLGDAFIDNKVVALQGAGTFPNEDRPSILRGDGTSGGHFALDAEI